MAQLAYDIFATELGWVMAVASTEGFRHLTLPQPSPLEALALVGPDGDKASLRPGWFRSLQQQLEAYFAGEVVSFDFPLDTVGAPAFFQSVWQACRTIPYGETRSYAWLAAQSGSPRAVRAVGQAMARNRLPILVPCHRVIASDGSLCGFRDGLDLKRRLLNMEAKATAKA